MHASMEPNLESWNVILAGAWDVRLFTPEWLSTHLFYNGQLDVELGVGAGFHTIRFVGDQVVITPTPERLVFGVREATPACLSAAVSAATLILGLLPHTPVAGAGINISYHVHEPPASMVELFEFHDSSRMNALKCKVQGAEITRSILMADWNAQINLKCLLHEGKIYTEINHHFPVVSTDQAARCLGGCADRAYSISIDLLDNLYGISLGGMN